MGTLKDVAELAAVSTATVSRVLNDDSARVSDETRRVVRAAADSVGYVMKDVRDARDVPDVIERTQDERRIIARWAAALEYIRLRDVMRLWVNLGMDVPAEHQQTIAELERRLGELAPPPRSRASEVEFPDWVTQ